MFRLSYNLLLVVFYFSVLSVVSTVARLLHFDPLNLNQRASTWKCRKVTLKDSFFDS